MNFFESEAQVSPTILAGLDSFEKLVAKQQPVWPNLDELSEVRASLSKLAPLVAVTEIELLKKRLAQAAAGKAFLLQGGDCAETFADATAERIQARVKTLLQMAVVLTYGASMPVVKMGRMAGQFAKPRSSDMETRGSETLPAYRGDAVNGYDFTSASRTADPKRMLQAYETSKETLSLIREFTQGGLADLRLVHEWNKGFVTSTANAKYEDLAKDIDKAIKFMAACGADFTELKTTEFYSSHEGLLFDYERPLTRVEVETEKAYVTSSHFLWIGERTRQLDGAHVEFFSKVCNPIGIKIGPEASVSDVLALLEKLDPTKEPGRITLITRMGAGRVRDELPRLVEAVKNSGSNPLWVTDPMHGNGITTKNGYKSRRFDDVMDEVRGFFEVHRAHGTFPGGVHVELTGDDVAECLGGFEKIDEHELESRYESLCDPRLNHTQSLELAFLVAEELSGTDSNALSDL